MAATISANSAGGGGLVSSGDASGVLALQTAGVTALSIDASQKVTFVNSLTSPTLVTPVINGMASSILTSGTAVASTSGTSIDFTGIPSWVKRITVMFNGVSTNGTSVPLVRLGGSGGIETTGYDAASSIGSTTAPQYYASTVGFPISTTVQSATTLLSGSVVFTNISGNIWIENGSMSLGQVGQVVCACGGTKTLSYVLTQVRITTVNGTDTFDAGSINIMYE